MDIMDIREIFMLFIKVMPKEEIIDVDTFMKKLEEKEHDDRFRQMVIDFTHNNHPHEQECVNADRCICSQHHQAVLAREIFRELLK